MDKKLDVDDLRTPRGGWKRADLERLGVAWPPPKGWLKHLKRQALASTREPLPLRGEYHYRHNSRKPLSCYHIATREGTVCKLENGLFYKYQDTLTDTPPDKLLCSICREKAAIRELDAAIPWERFDGF